MASAKTAVALVTGAAHGIGRAITQRLLQDGWHVGKPTDIAEIVAWLLDGERAGFVTGANFVVDGGMTRKMIYEE